LAGEDSFSGHADPRQAILEEIIRLTEPPILREDEFTREDLLRVWGSDVDALVKRMKRRGLVESVGARRDPRSGKIVHAWRVVAEKSAL